MTIILNVQQTENDTSPKSVIFKQFRLPKDMKFYLKYGLSLNYLLTYVAETKVILREMYSILNVNEKLPVSKFRYFGKYLIQLFGYYYVHVSGQRQAGLEK